MNTLAIVGSAGRKEDGAKVSSELYAAMVQKAKDTIRVLSQEHHIEIDCLVSGGAAFADHVAVTLFLMRYVPRLMLFLPCPFDPETAKFADERGDTGTIANHHHMKFSNKLGFDSRLQLKKAMEMEDCLTRVKMGFKNRNSLVAFEADALLAMTFGSGPVVKDGGTADTVAKFLARKDRGPAYHMDLAQKLCYRNARVA